MEEKIIMEQPDITEQVTANVGEQNTQYNMGESKQESDIGSNQFGKFKDATTLYEAYNNLQKEFTKKSQQLAEILKSSEQHENNGNLAENGKITQDFNINNDKNAVFDNNNTSSEHGFAYKNKDWTNKVILFFNSKNDAKQYSKEISNLLIEDKSLAQNENCLEYAYAIVKNKHSKEPVSYLNDQKFLEDNVYNNNLIKNKIIEDYLSSAIKNKSVKVITGQAENLSLTPPADKPKNIKEASLILKKLLQQ